MVLTLHSLKTAEIQKKKMTRGTNLDHQLIRASLVDNKTIHIYLYSG